MDEDEGLMSLLRSITTLGVVIASLHRIITYDGFRDRMGSCSRLRRSFDIVIRDLD